MRTTIATVLLALLVAAGCSSDPTPWEAHGEAKWSEYPGVFELTANMDDVIEGYNAEYEFIVGSYDAPSECALVEEQAQSNLATVAQTATMDGASMRKIQDTNTGAVLADGDWMELNDCPQVGN